MSIETVANAKTSSFNAQSADFRADSLWVWDMQSYARLYQETNSWDTVRQVMINDGLGLVTEKISSEKDQYGNYFFDAQTRARLQLTPAKHVYYEIEDPETGELLMVPPELLEARKDVMRVISPWRRGLDQKVMGVVRDVFLNKPEQKGPIIWTSTKAESDEGPEVYVCSGKYGWLYVGHSDVDEIGRRRLTVYNYKYPGSPDAALEFIYRGAEQIYYAENEQPMRLSDEAMTTVVTANPEISWDPASVWQHLSSIQQEVTGESKIFGLSPETIIKLQDPRLHQFLKAAVAVKMADWMMGEMAKGVAAVVLQSQIRAKFIAETQASLNLYLDTDFYGGRRYSTATKEDADDYNGSNGDSCGDWGDSGGGSMTEMAAGCQEIQCKKCGWKPKSADLVKIKKGQLTACPIQGCGWSPGSSQKIQANLN